MAQYGYKAALERFPTTAERVVVKELKHVHHHNTFVQQDTYQLTREQRRGALQRIMAVKEKNNVSLKGHL